MYIKDLVKTDLATIKRAISDGRDPLVLLYSIKRKEYFLFNLRHMTTRKFWYSRVAVYKGIATWGIINLRASDWYWTTSTEILLSINDLIDVEAIESLSDKDKEFLAHEREILMDKIKSNRKYEELLLGHL